MQHKLKGEKKKTSTGNEQTLNRKALLKSMRAAPNIENGNPRAAKRPTLQMQDKQLQGPMLDMQIRVRQKEAKRKEVEAEITANKKM